MFDGLNLDATIRDVASGAVCLNIALVVLLAPAVIYKTRLRSPRAFRQELGVTALIFMVAFAIRWWLPDHAFVHEYNHSYGEAGAQSFRDVWNPINYSAVGSAPKYIAWLMSLIAPSSDEIKFLTNAIFSASGVAGFYHVARLIFSCRASGYFAALILGIFPLSVILAPTEEPMNSAVALCISGLGFLLAGVKRNSRLSGVFGGLLVCLGATAHPVAAPLSGLVLFALCAVKPDDGKRDDGLWAASFMVLAVFAFPRLLLAVPRLSQVSSLLGWPNLIVGLPGDKNDWVGWYDQVSPRWMIWLVFVGWLGMFIEAFRRRLPLGVLCFVIGGFLYSQAAGGAVISGYFPSFLRHQLLALSLFLLPGGWVLARGLQVVSLLGDNQRHALMVGTLMSVALVLVAFASPSKYRLDTPGMREYLFLVENIPHLEDEATLIQADDETPESLYPNMFLPQGWVEQHKPQWHATGASAWLNSDAAENQRTPFYFVLGRGCFNLREIYEQINYCAFRLRPPEGKYEGDLSELSDRFAGNGGAGKPPGSVPGSGLAPMSKGLGLIAKFVGEDSSEHPWTGQKEEHEACIEVKEKLRGEFSFTKYGFMNRRCKRVLEHGNWREVASREIPGAPEFWPTWYAFDQPKSLAIMPHGILYGTSSVTLAVFEFKDKGSSEP